MAPGMGPGLFFSFLCPYCTMMPEKTKGCFPARPLKTTGRAARAFLDKKKPHNLSVVRPSLELVTGVEPATH